MDVIFIRDLKIDTVVGIYPREQQLPQTLKLDLEIGLQDCQAFVSDQIADALDYAQVTAQIKQLLQDKHFMLLETMAEQVALLVLQYPLVANVKLSIAKLQAIRDCGMVGVQIERSQGA